MPYCRFHAPIFTSKLTDIRSCSSIRSGLNDSGQVVIENPHIFDTFSVHVGLNLDDAVRSQRHDADGQAAWKDAAMTGGNNPIANGHHGACWQMYHTRPSCIRPSKDRAGPGRFNNDGNPGVQVGNKQETGGPAADPGDPAYQAVTGYRGLTIADARPLPSI